MSADRNTHVAQAPPPNDGLQQAVERVLAALRPALRAALAPTPAEVEAEVEAFALAVVARMKAEHMDTSASMTVAEFAKKAKVTAGYAHQLIREGKLEASNPGGKGDRRITAAAVAKYFAGGTA